MMRLAKKDYVISPKFFSQKGAFYERFLGCEQSGEVYEFAFCSLEKKDGFCEENVN